MVVSCQLATYYELGTIYGTQDLHDLLEIAMVDSFNKWRAVNPDG